MGINVERSNNTVITGNYAVNNSCGIHVSLGNFGTVTGNNATNNSEYGIWLAISLNNTVIDNYVAGNRAGGIRVDNASNNTISGNKIKDNSNAGISCRYGSHNNTIVGNDISNSTRCGIEFYLLQTQNTIIGNNITDSGEDGISMLWSALNIISSNNITNSTRDGIHVEGFLYLGEDPEDTIVFGSMNNSITWNNVMFSGRYAIYMEAYNNTIHHNRFVGYTAPTFSDAAYPNIWDDGYPSGGNYWSDFKERYPHVEDVYSGEYPQSVPGSDGFWDSPYEINENNIDHYPIVPEFPSSIVLPIFMVLTIAAVVFRKKKTTRTKA
jgi:parallel beta-helix repeat protein